MFSHNQIFALFSSVAVQREQRKNQEQGNIYQDLSVRSCAESVCFIIFENINKKAAVFN